MRTVVLSLALLASVVIQATPAYALTPYTPTISTDPVGDATVNLYCRLKSGNKIYTTTGSGVFISDRGVILTNAHVAQYQLLASERGRVRGECQVRTGSPAKNTYTASVLFFPQDWIAANEKAIKSKEPKGTGESDFALLYVTGAAKNGVLPEKFPYVPVSFSDAKEGETVTVAGYPVERIRAKDVASKLPQIVTTTTVTNVRGLTSYTGSDVLTLASSTAAGAGVSGGPVARTDNTLTGIVVAKSDTVLRAITPSHMNGILLTQTGQTLSTISLGDLWAKAAANRALLTGKQLIVLRDALLRKR